MNHTGEIPSLKLIKIDLKLFWKEFGKINYKHEKLDLLTKYSEKVYRFKSRESIEVRRFKFEKMRRFKRFFKYPCRVCNGFPVIRHHIICLKNGGGNSKKNIISICEECHAWIHKDWMMPPSVQGSIDCVDSEYKSVVGVF
jgi:HNH endonuclease